MIVTVDSPGISTDFNSLRVSPNPSTHARRRISWDSISPDLESTREKLKRSSSPLLAMPGEHANNVFPLEFDGEGPEAVFKPGRVDMVNTILCRKIATILSLDECIPPTIEARAPLVVSKEDLDDNLEPIVYEKMYIGNTPWYANLDDCKAVKRKTDQEVVLCDGSQFAVEREDDGFTLKPKNNKDENHPFAYELIRFALCERNTYVVKYASIHPIKVDGIQSYVERGSSRLRLVSSTGPVDDDDDDDDLFEKDSTGDEAEIPDAASFRQEDVEGFIQPWIRHVPVDDTVASQVVMSSLINNLFLAILCRYQDGKLSFNSKNSNFLFTPLEEGYHLTAIDLGETWPESNDYQDTAKKIACLRLGLLKLPQTRCHLSSEHKAHCSELLERIKTNRDMLLAEIMQAELKNKEKVVQAFKEVLERLSAFNASEYSLRDIVFTVFPVYKEQYMQLEQAGIALDVIADNLGLHGVDDILKR